jgi:hypothetical protein
LCIDAQPQFQTAIKGVLKDINGIELEFRSETKALYRMAEKALLKGPHSKSTGGDGMLPDDELLDCSRVCDVVGCLVVCDGFRSMRDVVDRLKRQIPKEAELEICQVKSRWEGASDGGWRDAMCMLAVGRRGSKRIICEVQIVLDTLLVARKGLKGHKAYALFRSYFEMLTFEGLLLPSGAGAARGSPLLC